MYQLEFQGPTGPKFQHLHWAQFCSLRSQRANTQTDGQTSRFIYIDIPFLYCLHVVVIVIVVVLVLLRLLLPLPLLLIFLLFLYLLLLLLFLLLILLRVLLRLPFLFPLLTLQAPTLSQVLFQKLRTHGRKDVRNSALYIQILKTITLRFYCQLFSPFRKILFFGT